MKTIPQLAKELGITPQAVHKAKSKAESTLGYSIDGIVSDSDKRKILYSEAQIETIKRFLSSSTVDKPVAKPVEIVEGNHNEAVGLATVPQNYSLDRFRTDTTRLDLALNPSDYLATLTSALDTVESFMSEAEAIQQQRLHQIQETNLQAKQRLNQFKERKLEHKLRTEMIAQIQNNAVEDFQAVASEIHSLGVLQEKQ